MVSVHRWLPRDALCIGVNANFNFQSCVWLMRSGGCFQRDADQMAIEIAAEYRFAMHRKW